MMTIKLQNCIQLINSGWIVPIPTSITWGLLGFVAVSYSITCTGFGEPSSGSSMWIMSYLMKKWIAKLTIATNGTKLKQRYLIMETSWRFLWKMIERSESLILVPNIPKLILDWEYSQSKKLESYCIGSWQIGTFFNPCEWKYHFSQIFHHRHLLYGHHFKVELQSFHSDKWEARFLESFDVTDFSYGSRSSHLNLTKSTVVKISWSSLFGCNPDSMFSRRDGWVSKKCGKVAIIGAPIQLKRSRVPSIGQLPFGRQ